MNDLFTWSGGSLLQSRISGDETSSLKLTIHAQYQQ
jgi:hypothetical protein